MESITKGKEELPATTIIAQNSSSTIMSLRKKTTIFGVPATIVVDKNQEQVNRKD